jgi:hypothetical protein
VCLPVCQWVSVCLSVCISVCHTIRVDEVTDSSLWCWFLGVFFFCKVLLQFIFTAFPVLSLFLNELSLLMRADYRQNAFPARGPNKHEWVSFQLQHRMMEKRQRKYHYYTP